MRMKLDDLNIQKNGSLTIGSIFEVGRPMAITELIFKCRDAGCTLHFENENLTIDSSYNDDDILRGKVMLYTLLAGHPEAALLGYNQIRY
jgi:hypothetical protein